jgi:hypothetical protein
VDSGLPVVSCVFAPSLDTAAHIAVAERLGYRRAWCYDSPAMYADPWMVMALAAPGRSRPRAAIETVDAARRHLAIHDGHLVTAGKHDEALVASAAPLLTKWTTTGTAAEVRTRLRALSAGGITEIAYQPMGPDIPRELRAFAEAAGLAAAAGAGAERP